jgi:hypothetical protein
MSWRTKIGARVFSAIIILFVFLDTLLRVKSFYDAPGTILTTWGFVRRMFSEVTSFGLLLLAVGILLLLQTTEWWRRALRQGWDLFQDAQRQARGVPHHGEARQMLASSPIGRVGEHGLARDVQPAVSLPQSPAEVWVAPQPQQLLRSVPRYTRAEAEKLVDALNELQEDIKRTVLPRVTRIGSQVSAWHYQATQRVRFSSRPPMLSARGAMLGEKPSTQHEVMKQMFDVMLPAFEREQGASEALLEETKQKIHNFPSYFKEIMPLFQMVDVSAVHDAARSYGAKVNILLKSSEITVSELGSIIEPHAKIVIDTSQAAVRKLNEAVSQIEAAKERIKSGVIQ